MLFNEFGQENAPVLLLMHGMMQDWHSVYELLKPLEQQYRLIIPAMDGFYDNSGDFTSFADQCRQIENYVLEKHNGQLFGAFGASQGALLLTELLTRNKLSIGSVIMDGCYVAHQGKIAGWVTYKMFCKYKNSGKFPLPIHLMMTLMGMKLEDMLGDMARSLYLDASDESVKRNFMENYTYHVRPELAETKSFVHLWCGSKEPYALKSHRILKQYLKNYREEIMEDLGHGEYMIKQPQKYCVKIHSTLQSNAK